MHLSAFRGGWTREAAQAVAAADRHSLRRLSNKALIEVLDGGCLSMHELLQQFGAEKLAQSGQGLLIQSKHTAFLPFSQRNGGEIVAPVGKGTW